MQTLCNKMNWNILTRIETIENSCKENLPSFFFWELVDAISNFIMFCLYILAYEKLIRPLLFN